MGLTKQYLSFVPAGIFNIISSTKPNIVFVDLDSTPGRYIAVGAAERIFVWDLRLGEKSFELIRDKEEVTSLRNSPDGVHLAAGYVDGIVEIFNLKTKKSVCSFSIHRSAITCLRYDLLGMRLISGSNDTDIVVSDFVSQSGICRLSGHSAPVTDIRFIEKYNIIISSSKDTQIKFWNVETHSCFKTIIDHRTEVWNIALMRDDEFLIAGSTESNLRVYRLSENVSSTTTSIEQSDFTTAGPINCNFVGTIQRVGRGRIHNMLAESTGSILAYCGTDDQIELFKFYSAEEAAKRLQKRLKKLSLKETSDAINNSKELGLTDEIHRLNTIRTNGKVKSFDFLLGANNELRVCVGFADNSLKLFNNVVTQKASKSEVNIIRSIQQQGHHSEVRCVSFSSDNLAIATGSGESVKLWNRSSKACLRTVETEYVLCLCFVPGDRHIIAGLKNGNILIIDIVIGEIIETIQAHEKELWCISLLPDSRGCVTGGGDSTVKLWLFELVAAPEIKESKVLSLLHKKTLQLEETALSVRISSNNKYLAVALLDSTVKIFFLDTFKFYLALYGHKLPVLCMDISYDSTLIATGSADRNVKIWGMDYGDCHRSLFAHDDSVMSLKFVPKTHLFFTCGKDGKVKQWDADNFEKIITLSGHIGEAFDLAISTSGLFIVSCGSDRTLRLYERSDEPLVLQDAQETEREENENNMLATGNETIIPTLPGLKLPSKKTIGAEKAAESILECIDICEELENDIKGPLPPIMKAYNVNNADDFILTVLAKIRASDLEEALLILPFNVVCNILMRIPKLVIKRKDQMEIICKVVLFLFRVHQKPIVNNKTLIHVIQEMITNIGDAVVELRNILGMNYHALQMLQHEIESNDGIELFTDATKAKRLKDKKHRHRTITKRLHIQMST